MKSLLLILIVLVLSSASNKAGDFWQGNIGPYAEIAGRRENLC
jgi:hypothetical protein